MTQEILGRNYWCSGYGEISSALVFVNAHMFVLEVRVQYTIKWCITYCVTVVYHTGSVSTVIILCGNILNVEF